MASVPKFDPNQPFEEVTSTPQFDPAQPFEEVSGTTTDGGVPSQIIQEMHPDVSYWDRFKVKATSANPTNTINYLQKTYPDMQFAIEDGQVLARRRDERDWRVLDPNFGEGGVGEALADMTDVVGDVGIAAAETAAAAGGALVGGIGGAAAGTAAAPGPGTIAGGVGGAVAGGSLAGGQTAGLLERGRQKVGQWLGVNPEGQYDQETIDTAKTMGYLAGPLGGVGKAGMTGVKALTKAGVKEAAEKSLLRETVEKATLETAERGLLMKSLEKGVPAGSEFLGEKLPKFAEKTVRTGLNLGVSPWIGKAGGKAAYYTTKVAAAPVKYSLALGGKPATAAAQRFEQFGILRPAMRTGLFIQAEKQRMLEEGQ